MTDQAKGTTQQRWDLPFLPTPPGEKPVRLVKYEHGSFVGYEDHAAALAEHQDQLAKVEARADFRADQAAAVIKRQKARAQAAEAENERLKAGVREEVERLRKVAEDCNEAAGHFEGCHEEKALLQASEAEAVADRLGELLEGDPVPYKNLYALTGHARLHLRCIMAGTCEPGREGCEFCDEIIAFLDSEDQAGKEVGTDAGGEAVQQAPGSAAVTPDPASVDSSLSEEAWTAGYEALVRLYDEVGPLRRPQSLLILNTIREAVEEVLPADSSLNQGGGVGSTFAFRVCAKCGAQEGRCRHNMPFITPEQFNRVHVAGVAVEDGGCPELNEETTCPRSSTEEQRTSKPTVAGSSPAGGSQARGVTRRSTNEHGGYEDNPRTARIENSGPIPGLVGLRTEQDPEPGDKSEVPAAPDDEWPWPPELWIGGDEDRPWRLWWSAERHDLTCRRYVPAQTEEGSK